MVGTTIACHCSTYLLKRLEISYFFPIYSILYRASYLYNYYITLV